MIDCCFWSMPVSIRDSRVPSRQDRLDSLLITKLRVCGSRYGVRDISEQNVVISLRGFVGQFLDDLNTFIATWFIACIAFNCSLCRAETLFVIIQTRVASTPLSNATVFNKLTCSNLGNAQNLRMLIGTSRQGHAGTITPSRESPKWISMLCIIGVRIS